MPKALDMDQDLCGLASYVVQMAPAQGLRVVDIRPGGRIERMLKKFEWPADAQGPQSVTLEDDELVLMRALWTNFDIGGLIRTPPVTKSLISLDDLLKE